MNVYALTHEGHYPVGACSVVVAEDESSAKTALLSELKARGIVSSNEVEAEAIFSVREVDASQPGVMVVLDGNY